MATNKSIRKKRQIKYFNRYILRGRFWYIKQLCHRSCLNDLFNRELDQKRMRKKCISFLDYSKIKPMFSFWSVPVVQYNPCKKSRIRHHVGSYRMMKAEEIPSPSGVVYTQMTLMNLHLANGGEDE